MTEQAAREAAKAEAWIAAMERRYRAWALKQDVVRGEDWTAFVRAHDPQHDSEYECWAIGFDAAWAACEVRVRENTLAKVEARAAGYFARAEAISDEYISAAIHNQGVGIINAVQAVRAAGEGQDGE